jgi:hypothetical protein
MTKSAVDQGLREVDVLFGVGRFYPISTRPVEVPVEATALARPDADHEQQLVQSVLRQDESVDLAALQSIVITLNANIGVVASLRPLNHLPGHARDS